MCRKNEGTSTNRAVVREAHDFGVAFYGPLSGPRARPPTGTAEAQQPARNASNTASLVAEASAPSKVAFTASSDVGKRSEWSRANRVGRRVQQDRSAVERACRGLLHSATSCRRTASPAIRTSAQSSPTSSSTARASRPEVPLQQTYHRPTIWADLGPAHEGLPPGPTPAEPSVPVLFSTAPGGPHSRPVTEGTHRRGRGRAVTGTAMLRRCLAMLSRTAAVLANAIRRRSQNRPANGTGTDWLWLGDGFAVVVDGHVQCLSVVLRTPPISDRAVTAPHLLSLDFPTSF